MHVPRAATLCFLPSFFGRYVALLLLLCNFTFAVLGVAFFGANDPHHFRSLDRAMMTIWGCETFDEWEEGLYIAMYKPPAVFFAARPTVNVISPTGQPVKQCVSCPPKKHHM